MKKLTLAIPVFNGANKISKLLDSIFSNNFDSKEYDVVISDNCSTDNISKILEPYLKENSNISYFRNEKNLGPDINFLKCVERSNSEYVWIIGDDDVLPLNAIELLMPHLEKDLSAVIINYSIINDYFQVERVVNCKEIKIFKGPDDVIKNIGLPMNYLSSVIHRRELFMKVDTSKLLYSHWLQLGVFLEEANMKKSMFLPEPLVINAGDSLESSVNQKEKAIFVIKSFFRVSSQYLLQEQTKKAFLKYSFIHVLRKVYIAKRTGYSFRTEDLNFFLEWYKGMPIHSFLIFLLFRTSNSILSFFYYLSKKTRINSLLFKLIK